MKSSRLALTALVALLLIPFGVAWAAHASSARTASDEALSVETDRTSYTRGDDVRIWLRNTGPSPIEGAPNLLILNDQGGVVRSFQMTEFHLTLDPGEAVWVEWSTGPTPIPCMYGEVGDKAGAMPARPMPCPMQAQAAGADAGLACYGCRSVIAPASYVIVGIFGPRADATVIHVE